MAFVRLLRNLLRDKEFGRYVVPVVPDEARTFGMESLFAEVKIYAPKGQLYEPVDHNLLLAYREAKSGQILEEGITEAGAMASTTAAGTAYATHGLPTVPFYIFYSMFGFQRVGDLIWAFGDSMGRGFLLGATAGRTTLQGEGLQHCDGHSHVLFSVMPNVRAYDPAFAYEVAVLIRDGLERMVRRQEDCFYYLTLYNENYPQPPMPEGVEEGIIRGLYLFRDAPPELPVRLQLFGSGPILREVLRAQELLAERFGLGAEVWSVTSYPLLYRDALACERWNRLHPLEPPRKPYLAQVLDGHPGPVVAASDFLKLLPDSLGRFLGRPLLSLGTDGFGLSDTRAAARRYFEVDAEHVTAAALYLLAQQGELAPQVVAQALADLGLDPEAPDPASR